MTTKINAVTIADPYDYQANLEILGSLQRSANGTILYDYFSTTPKNRIKMQWRLLTLTERNAIITQSLNTIATARTLEIPDTRTFSVHLDPETDITEILIRDAGGYKYNLALSFVEV